MLATRRGEEIVALDNRYCSSSGAATLMTTTAQKPTAGGVVIDMQKRMPGV